MIDQDFNLKYVRQQDVVPKEIMDNKITVVGAGAVGSCATLAFAKTGFKNLRVFDFDNVELHNLPNQMYRNKDLGQPKVEALKSMINDFEGFDISIAKRRYAVIKMKDTIIISVDSMDARIEIWNRAKECFPDVNLYIDARMGAEVLRLYTVIPEMSVSVDKYEKTLYTSEEAEQVPCTAKSTMYTALLLGSLIVNQAKRAYVAMSDDTIQYPDFEIIYDLTTGVMING